EVVSQFDQNKITGILTRPYPLFNEETKGIFIDFFMNLLNDNSQGVALLKARQQCISKKMEKSVKDQVNDATVKDSITIIDLRSSLAVSSYLLFGKPWKRFIS
ncbi:MAG: hypothetical protein ACFFEO_17180, partial [Candidatus Thorarchaeota archaeon]